MELEARCADYSQHAKYAAKNALRHQEATEEHLAHIDRLRAQLETGKVNIMDAQDVRERLASCQHDLQVAQQQRDRAHQAEIDATLQSEQLFQQIQAQRDLLDKLQASASNTHSAPIPTHTNNADLSAIRARQNQIDQSLKSRDVTQGDFPPPPGVTQGVTSFPAASMTLMHSVDTSMRTQAPPA